MPFLSEKMKHPFKYRCYDAKTLLEGCNTLSMFMRRLEKQAHEDRGMGWTYEDYVGMGFEAFVEVLINLSPIDKRIGIVEYSPHDNDKHGQDMGIDGYGLSAYDRKPHTIQCKYRGNTQKSLTANEDHISNFVAKSLGYGPDIGMTIFTTGKDLMEKINQEMYNGRVRTLGYRELSKLVDENRSFWDAFLKEMT